MPKQVVQAGDLGPLLDQMFVHVGNWIAENLRRYQVPLTPAVGRGLTLRAASVARSLGELCSVDQAEITKILMASAITSAKHRPLDRGELGRLLDEMYDRDAVNRRDAAVKEEN